MDKIYVLMERGIDYNQRDRPRSYHRTIEGAEQAIPEQHRELRKTPAYASQSVVRSYDYFEICEISVLP